MPARHTAAAAFASAQVSMPFRCGGLNEAVLDVLVDDLLSPALIERVRRDVVAHFADPAHNGVARRQDLLKRRAELDATISRLVDAIAAGGDCGSSLRR
jgi:hypothetical protein